MVATSNIFLEGSTPDPWEFHDPIGLAHIFLNGLVQPPPGKGWLKDDIPSFSRVNCETSGVVFFGWMESFPLS